jgi:hypothetical protein
MALSRTTSSSARADDTEQRHMLRHAFERVATALLGDEQTINLGAFENVSCPVKAQCRPHAILIFIEIPKA